MISHMFGNYVSTLLMKKTGSINRRITRQFTSPLSSDTGDHWQVSVKVTFIQRDSWCADTMLLAVPWLIEALATWTREGAGWSRTNVKV